MKPNNVLSSFGGFELHGDPSMVDPITRTWRARLLSWPWRPWVRIRYVPQQKFFKIDTPAKPPWTPAVRMIVAHPVIIERIKEMFS